MNVRPKKVTIILDKERHLVFDLNAFAALEDVYPTINEAFAALQTGSVKAIRALLWAGLVHEDEKLTIKRLGTLVTPQKLDNVVNKITEAIDESLPESDPNSNPSLTK